MISTDEVTFLLPVSKHGRQIVISIVCIVLMALLSVRVIRYLLWLLAHKLLGYVRVQMSMVNGRSL